MRRGKSKPLLPVLVVLALAFFVRPAVSGGKVTSWYGPRLMSGRIFHTGTDYGLPVGTPVMTVAPGSVTETGFDERKGNYVTISHLPGVTSSYLHLDSISVSGGQRLRRDNPIGTVGNTGISTGSHLHLEIRLFGIPLPAGILSLPGRIAGRLGAYRLLESANIP